MGNSIEAIDQGVFSLGKTILGIMLKDRTTNANILWKTNDYADYGNAYEPHKEILPKLITVDNTRLIVPRMMKERATQRERTKVKAEIFTPSWLCNDMCNLIDESRFGRKDVFNTTGEQTWESTKEPVPFPYQEGKTWQTYVDENCLEITCGEAPFLVSRYDTVSGEPIAIGNRIGVLDRKLRVVNENADNEADWLKWAQRAVEATYGYEYQGDSLFIARENVLFTYIDYVEHRLHRAPTAKELKTIATVISWNVWQMDGLKFVVPASCGERKIVEETLLGEEAISVPCVGCKKNDWFKHNGIYCNVMDWRVPEVVRFVDILKKKKTGD